MFGLRELVLGKTEYVECVIDPNPQPNGGKTFQIIDPENSVTISSDPERKDVVTAFFRKDQIQKLKSGTN